MDEETKREFGHVAETLKKFEQDSRTVIALDLGFKNLSKDFEELRKLFEKLGKKLDRQALLVGTVGLGIIGDLVTRLLELKH